MPASILLIEDDPSTVRHLARTLAEAREPFQLTSVDTIAEGLRHLTAHPFDCVLLDYRLPDGDGLTALRAIRHDRQGVPVIMITGAGSEELAVAALKLGAADYVVKHACWIDKVPEVLREAIGARAIRAANERESNGNEQELPEAVRARWRAAGVIGESRALVETILLAEHATSGDVTVLIEGETGTGKEMFARAIHRHGPREHRPMIAVNCAALPEALLESELFGHVRGAFSGADRDHRGLFEAADGGTLFLDEVCELTPAVQAKLLRVLQEKEVRPVGATRSRTIDVRVIAAANRDLSRAVAEGRFRIDLYHRLQAFSIRLPPLRERCGDIPILAAHFLQLFAERERRTPLTLDRATVIELDRYSWPGNVRELENVIHRLALCARPGSRIGTPALSGVVAQPNGVASSPRLLKEIVREVEVATIIGRLRDYGYRRAATARSLGLTREGLWQKLRQLGVRPPSRDLEPRE